MDFFRYGMGPVLGKALAVFLLLASPALAEKVTVLAFGDSLTQGYGLPRDDGFVPQMQRWLDAHGADTTLINGGVSGSTTAGGLRRVDWSLTGKVDAMILNLGGNDFLRGLDPALIKANLAGILEAAKDRDVAVLLVGLKANGNYGPAYRDSFDALFPDLAQDYGVSLYPYFFDGLGRGTPESFLPYFQSDGIHPNAKGVQLIVQDMGPAVQRLTDMAQ